MVQFNLLPDVKLTYMKARARKRLILGASIISSGVFVFIFIVLFLYVRVSQTKNMRDLSKDISSTVKQIQNKDDIDKILTIQNQLASLPALHDNKVISSRLMDYLVKLVPNQANISKITVDLAGNTMLIEGGSDSLSTTNKFVDTLKFTDFKQNNDGGRSGKAFSSVVLQNFLVDNINPNPNKKINYTIQLTYDPAIFENIKGDVKDGAEAVELIVPNIISTRSETEKPSQLFLPNNQSGQSR